MAARRPEILALPAGIRALLLDMAEGSALFSVRWGTTSYTLDPRGRRSGPRPRAGTVVAAIGRDYVKAVRREEPFHAEYALTGAGQSAAAQAVLAEAAEKIGVAP